MGNAVHQQLLKGDEAFATSLVAILIDDFGTEALAWAPKTIVMELETSNQVDVSVTSVNRLMAAIHLLTSNSFYVSLPDFNDLCNVLAWEPVTPGIFIPADAAACGWGITEAMLLSPPDDEDNAFSEEIRAFVGEVLKDEGILTPPDVLRIANFDKNLYGKVKYDYSDDPSMFEAIFSVEESKTQELNDFIKKRLRALVLQLGTLKLRNGSVEEIAEKMLNALPAPGAGGSPL